MKVMFCRSNKIGSWLIRALTWSDWSHTVLLTPEGTAIEATWPCVREVPLEVVLTAHSEHQIEEIPCRDADAAAVWARRQIGLPYDWRALFGFIVHRNWTDPKRWFCSELVAGAFEEGGSPLVRADAVSRVTPQVLWMVAPGQGEFPQT